MQIRKEKAIPRGMAFAFWVTEAGLDLCRWLTWQPSADHTVAPFAVPGGRLRLAS